MRRIARILLRIFIVVIILVTGAFGGILLDRHVLLGYVAPSNVPPAAAQDFQLIAQAWNYVQKVYVDRSAVQDVKLTYGAISGMINALGDTGHSRFMSPQMVKSEASQTSGKFEGIGVEVQQKNGAVVIVAALDNSPAQKAGLHAGDIIAKVNGTDISGLTLDQVIPMILGPAGTNVTLTIQDPTTSASRDVTLTRAEIIIQNVTWQQIPGTTVADLRIAAFSSGVSDNLKTALAEIQQKGMTAIVLDLRDNPGGLLDESIGVTSQFVKSGDVLLVKDVNGKITHLKVETKWPVTTLRMVVLVNKGTASAAEIVSGALVANHRATLVGETTFGTGTVLNEFGLSDGSALLLATEEWLTPDGQVIWHKGISPNLVVDLPANVYPLTPETLRAITTAQQLQGSGDAQLLRALSLIENPTVLRAQP